MRMWSGFALVGVMIFLIGCHRKNISQNEKASYAIGQQLAQSMREQGINLNLEAFQQGVSDGLAKKNDLSNQEMQNAMSSMQQEASKKQLREIEDNGKAAAEFLTKNKSQPGVKVTKSGLQYIVERTGTGPTPKSKDVVHCHYRGTLITGEEFDSSYTRGQPADFPVTGVLKAWTEALQLMKVGGKMKIFVPPELAYGPSSRPHIPPNSALIYELELIGIDNKPK